MFCKQFCVQWKYFIHCSYPRVYRVHEWYYLPWFPLTTSLPTLNSIKTRSGPITVNCISCHQRLSLPLAPLSLSRHHQREGWSSPQRFRSRSLSGSFSHLHAPLHLMGFNLSTGCPKGQCKSQELKMWWIGNSFHVAFICRILFVHSISIPIAG